MFQQLKRLGTDTAIYGISTILGRFLNFLLVPFYTNVLTTGEYGVVTTVYALIAFVTVIYSYGMETAYFKYSSTLELGTRKENFSTPFWTLFGSSVIFSVVLIGFSAPIGSFLALPGQYPRIVLYAALMLALDAVAVIPFASLRMERKAAQFATIKFVNILVNVVMNIVLLVVVHAGVEGIFISGVVASAVTLLLLVPTTIRHWVFSVNGTLLKDLLRFALPYVPSGLAAMVIQVVDRPILRALTDDATVGIYQANYRLGIFMMLVVSMYDYAWRPFYFSVAREPDAKSIFARVLTYLVLCMSLILLVLTFFIEDVVKLTIFHRHIIHPDYWSGLPIVPVVLLGYLFLGVSTNVTAGLYIEKKTHLVPISTFIGAVVNVVANYGLIPRFGMMGAAWATLLAYAAMALSAYVIVQRVYPVRYELFRIAKIAFSSLLVLMLFWIAPSFGLIPGMLFKIVLIALFIALVALMQFFNREELGLFKRYLSLSRKTGNGNDRGADPPDRSPVG